MEKTLTVQEETMKVWNRIDSITEQEKAMKVFNRIYSTDLSSYVEVATLLSDLQPYTDHVDVSLPLNNLISKLLEAGYLPNVFMGDAFDGENEEIFARYLIGQAMDTMKSSDWGLIFPVYVCHFADFKKKFNIQ